MPTNERDHHERAPHSDGRLESIINDSTASAGETMGIRTDLNPENQNQPKNPFHVTPKKDKEMQKFSRFFE